MFQDVLKAADQKLQALKKILVMDSKGTMEVKLTPSSRKQIEEQINESYDKIRKFEELLAVKG